MVQVGVECLSLVFKGSGLQALWDEMFFRIFELFFFFGGGVEVLGLESGNRAKVAASVRESYRESLASVLEPPCV